MVQINGNGDETVAVGEDGKSLYWARTTECVDYMQDGR